MRYNGGITINLWRNRMAKTEQKSNVFEEEKKNIEHAAEMVVDAAKETSKTVGGLFRRVFLAAIGAAVVAEEEVVGLINRLVERGEIAENEARELIKEIVDKRETEAKETISKIRRSNTIKVATKADVDALQGKLDSLSEKLDQVQSAK